jgi:hypothetical protein
VKGLGGDGVGGAYTTIVIPCVLLATRVGMVVGLQSIRGGSGESGGTSGSRHRLCRLSGRPTGDNGKEASTVGDFVGPGLWVEVGRVVRVVQFA